MKKIFSAFAIAAVITLAISSCKDDEETDPACVGVNCQNGGTCDNGTCDCPTGYGGTLCETKANAKFEGLYTGTETCNTGGGNITVVITALTDPLDLSIIYDGIALSADVLSYAGQQFTIPSQTVGGITYSGGGATLGQYGLYDININVTKSGGNVNSCSFNGDK